MSRKWPIPVCWFDASVPSVAVQSQKNTKGILNNGSAVFVHTMEVSGVQKDIQKGHKGSMPLFTLRIINYCMNRLY